MVCSSEASLFKGDGPAGSGWRLYTTAAVSDFRPVGAGSHGPLSDGFSGLRWAARGQCAGGPRAARGQCALQRGRPSANLPRCMDAPFAHLTRTVAAELDLRPAQTAAVADLLAGGATVPF